MTVEENTVAHKRGVLFNNSIFTLSITPKSHRLDHMNNFTPETMLLSTCRIFCESFDRIEGCVMETPWLRVVYR